MTHAPDTEALFARVEAKIRLRCADDNSDGYYGDIPVADLRALIAVARSAAAMRKARHYLDIDDTGDVWVYLVWALRPGEPQIVAICTDETVAARYKPCVEEQMPGAIFRTERVCLNHHFGNRDVQSAIYNAARRRSAALQSTQETEG